MRRIRPVSRAPIASRSLPAAAFRNPEPWEYWLGCLLSPISWIVGIKGCYCYYSKELPLQY
jgi:hypothetical protein